MLSFRFDKFFGWFERQTEPFPNELPEKPPTTFWGFIFYYAEPFRGLIIASALVATLVAVLEVILFAAVGNVVDWLTTANRETFFTDYGWSLIALLALIIVILPTLKFVSEAVVHNGILGNFSMRNRWQSHRYVLRQSVQFFNDDFAGRVATKVLQSSVSVREVVTKLAEVLVYVAVYFTAAVVMFALADWRLAVPMVLWFAAYL
ncbi:MAG: ABC transporter ATP-binding protein, partial [Pseudomonadota bacterium]